MLVGKLLAQQKPVTAAQLVTGTAIAFSVLWIDWRKTKCFFHGAAGRSQPVRCFFPFSFRSIFRLSDPRTTNRLLHR